MAVGDYLQVAAAQLENAAQAVKRQMDDMRHELSNFESQKHGEITSKGAEKRLRFVAMQGQEEPAERQHMAAQINAIEKEIKAKQYEIEQKRSEVTRTIHEKETAITYLQAKAQELKRQAGAM